MPIPPDVVVRGRSGFATCSFLRIDRRLIAAAGPEVTETYIDFFTATIRNRSTFRQQHLQSAAALLRVVVLYPESLSYGDMDDADCDSGGGW
jgi:hypothetical protein